MAYFEIETNGDHCEIYNITEQAKRAIARSDPAEPLDGALLLWVAHTTCALTVIEWEKGHRADICDWLEKQFPHSKTYQHDAAWGDGNGYAHLRAALVGPEVVVPVEKGELTLGPWQNLVLLDFDNKPRTRKIYYQILG